MRGTIFLVLTLINLLHCINLYQPKQNKNSSVATTELLKFNYPQSYRNYQIYLIINGISETHPTYLIELPSELNYLDRFMTA